MPPRRQELWGESDGPKRLQYLVMIMIIKIRSIIKSLYCLTLPALVKMVNGNAHNANVQQNVALGAILITRRLMGNILTTRGSAIMFSLKDLSVSRTPSEL